MLNSLTGLALTKLDVLTGTEEIRISTAYGQPGGETTTQFPQTSEELLSYESVYGDSSWLERRY
jgi:adenylosuccinate synthase